MASSLYQDRKYEVGQQLLILRARTRLTQADLAGLMGLNRRSIQNWETGVAYPKEDHLQRLMAIFLEHNALTPGLEREEAEGLWEQVSQDAPRPLPRFDLPWFEQLLAAHSITARADFPASHPMAERKFAVSLPPFLATALPQSSPTAPFVAREQE